MRKTALIFAAAVLSVCSPCLIPAHGSEAADGRLKVVTTLFPTYDFARQVGGDRADVTLLLPPGVEAHSFEPRAKDIARINKADMLVYTGRYMEPWVDDVAKGVSGGNLAVVDASAGVELMGEDDAHGKAAFEWAAAFDLDEGEYVWSFSKTGGGYAEQTMKIAVFCSEEPGEHGIEAMEDKASAAMQDGQATQTRDGGAVSPDSGAAELVFNPDSDTTALRIKVASKGHYVVFAEHSPSEFGSEGRLLKSPGAEEVRPVAQEQGHEHEHGNGHGHHHHGGMDPHIWLDLGRAQEMVRTIAAAFAAKDPDGKDYYAERAESYCSVLDGLDRRYRKTLASARHRTIIYAGHFAFGYLAARYGLEHVSPYAAGFAPDAEPSPKAIAGLITLLRASGQKVVFHEELIDPKVARTISAETGASLVLLHGAHNVSKEEMSSGVTFAQIMEDNLAKLDAGLECSSEADRN